MTWLPVAAGAAIVALVVWDIGLTLLHPTARGPLSYVLNRATWRLVRAVAIVLDRRPLLNFAGPLAMGVNVITWIGLLWIGFALVYLPFTDQLSFEGGAPFGRGPLEALYLSGTALTTVGFGDVVGGTGALRMVTILEAASGLGAFTAAITYILAVYPLVTALRSNSLHLYDLGVRDPERAARVIMGGRETELARIARDLVESHEHVRRFPILYYFESEDESESFGNLLRGSGTICLLLRWGFRDQALGHLDFYGPALQDSLVRVMRDLERDFIGGRRREPDPGQALGDDDAERRLARLRKAVAAVDEDLAEPAGPEDDGFSDFFVHLEGVLASLAAEHRHRREPLLED